MTRPLRELHVAPLEAADAAVADLGRDDASDALRDLPAEPSPPPAGSSDGAFVRLAEARDVGRLDLARTPGPRLGLVLDAAWLLALFALLSGPQPRRATRWAWFWISTTSLGLGLLWWLLDEHPWSRRARSRPEPLAHRLQQRQPGGDPRVTGGFGFVLMLAASVATWFALHLLRG